MSRTRNGSIALVLALVAVLAQSGSVVAVDQTSTFIWPTKGRITQPYGCTGFSWEPRYGNCKHFHGAFDIANTRGTPIRAAGAGVVTHAGWDPWGTGAWMVMIRHGGGLVTWYAHMRGKRIAGITKGARVRQGQVIGYMSDTGKTTGVHLHWSVLKDGRYANPRNYVEGKPSRDQTATQQKPPIGCAAPVGYSYGPTAAVLNNNDPDSALAGCTA